MPRGPLHTVMPLTDSSAPPLLLGTKGLSIAGIVQAAFNGVHERVEIDGLLQNTGKIVSIQPARVAGDDDNRHFTRIGVRGDLALHVGSAQKRQADIEHHEVRRVRVDMTKRINPVCHGDHRVPFEGQRCSIERPKLRVVLDDQYSRPLRDQRHQSILKRIPSITKAEPSSTPLSY